MGFTTSRVGTLLRFGARSAEAAALHPRHAGHVHRGEGAGREGEEVDLVAGESHNRCGARARPGLPQRDEPGPDARGRQSGVRAAHAPAAGDHRGDVDATLHEGRVEHDQRRQGGSQPSSGERTLGLRLQREAGARSETSTWRRCGAEAGGRLADGPRASGSPIERYERAGGRRTFTNGETIPG